MLLRALCSPIQWLATPDEVRWLVSFAITQGTLLRRNNQPEGRRKISSMPATFFRRPELRAKVCCQIMLPTLILAQAVLISGSLAPTSTLGLDAIQMSRLDRQDAATTIAISASMSIPTSVEIAPSGFAQTPRPFDTSIGNNFTAPSCPSFFYAFLTDNDFEQCLPFSLLLQTSTSFFTVSRSLVQISQTMDSICKVDFTSCSNIMSKLASQIRLNSNCGQDLQLQNPLVIQAYNGFLAYDSLYQAGCLKDSLGNYCYANAMMNSTDSSTYYVYYLPLGVQLPSDVQLSCNECLQHTMTLFVAGASNASKPLSEDYPAAAKIINSHCGSNFVQASVLTSLGNSSRLCHSAGSWCTVVLLCILVGML